MNLGRLSQVNAGTWLAPLLLALVLIAFQAFGSPHWTMLRYERAAIMAGEAWRLVSAHFIHVDGVHLAWNVAGLALVSWLFAREFEVTGWLAILAVSTITTSLGFLLFEPQLEWYVGFSGALHGLMAAGLCAWLLRSRDSLTALVAGLFVLKLGWEHFAGALPFTAATLTVPVIHAAHSYGAIGGTAAACWLLWRHERRARPSL
jgi:rhomboid family GlyGly-CTERM serine protease